MVSEYFPKFHILFVQMFLVVSMDCLPEPRDDDKLLCADGEMIDLDIENEIGWGGCYDRGSVRVQCPQNYYPCNNLRKASDYKEFICSKDCSKRGGIRNCYKTQGE